MPDTMRRERGDQKRERDSARSWWETAVRARAERVLGALRVRRAWPSSSRMSIVVWWVGLRRLGNDEGWD